MPRDLADVLHYFLPELDDASTSGDGTTAGSVTPVGEVRRRVEPAEERRVPQTPGIPILGLPIGDRDVVRAALIWNLAVETARLGSGVIVLTPAAETPTPLWPEAGIGPLGAELVFCQATDLGELAREAADLAKVRLQAKRSRTDAIFVRVPTQWLSKGEVPEIPIPWWLLISSPNHRDLSEAYDLIDSIRALSPREESRPSIGVTIHAVSRIAEAEQAYEHLSRRCASQLDVDLISYGLLVDDLHVYRAIAAQRPIGLAHPQAPATRALMDVARLLTEDASSLPLG